MSNSQAKNKTFTRRSILLGLGKLSLFSILLARFGQLQIVHTNKYKIMSHNNSVKILILPPLRGLLLDRYGFTIADNHFQYDLCMLSQFKKDAHNIVKSINNIFGYETSISQKGIKKTISAAGKDNYIIIQENLSWTEIAKIETQMNLNGVKIIKNQRRRYVLGESTAHITGYTASPTTAEVKASNLSYYNHFIVGKDGVEKTLNDILLGGPGVKKIEVNAVGSFVRELSYKQPSRGASTKLALDVKLQKIIVQNLANIVGSIAVIKIDNGEVIAMHSTPSYDPNKFVGGVDGDYWRALIENSEKPLINKNISNHYPPGSVFKIITALAILSSGIDSNKKIMCRGEHQFGNRKIRCWKEHGHGYVDMRSAIAKSCNIYFCTMSLLAGIDKISDIALKLGFNQRTNIELPFENTGLIPTRDWIKKRLKGQWNMGDTLNASIGQGYVLTTPIQLAVAFARIASGRCVKPTMLYGIHNHLDTAALDIDQQHLEIVRSGLYDVFNHQDGTGYTRRMHCDGKYYISGKTGTAQVIAQRKRNQDLQYVSRDHGIFTGYVSDREGPLYSIAVIAEHCGWGSSSALPIAIQSLQNYMLDN